MRPLFNHSANSVIVVVSISIIPMISAEREPHPAVLPAWKQRHRAVEAPAGCKSARTSVTLCRFASAALAVLLGSYRHPTQEKGDVKMRPRRWAARAAGSELARPGTGRGNQVGLNPLIPACRIFAILSSFLVQTETVIAVERFRKAG